MSQLHTKASLPSKDVPEHNPAVHMWPCQALCQHRGAYSPLGSACYRAPGGVRVSAGGGSDSKGLGGTQEMELGGGSSASITARSRQQRAVKKSHPAQFASVIHSSGRHPRDFIKCDCPTVPFTCTHLQDRLESPQSLPLQSELKGAL